MAINWFMGRFCMLETSVALRGGLLTYCVFVDVLDGW